MIITMWTDDIILWNSFIHNAFSKPLSVWCMLFSTTAAVLYDREVGLVRKFMGFKWQSWPIQIIITLLLLHVSMPTFFIDYTFFIGWICLRYYNWINMFQTLQKKYWEIHISGYCGYNEDKNSLCITSKKALEIY